MLKYDLYTSEAEGFDKAAPLSEYPRPQLRRDSYLCLNGVWQLALQSDWNEEPLPMGEITVPYSPESVLSGYSGEPVNGRIMVYTRKFNIDKDFLREVTLLHIGAADQTLSVTINGKFLGEFQNGYLPISVDISDAVCLGENEICLCVRDLTDSTYPIGKQRKKRGGIWYTPISGIWQTVWLESLPSKYIDGLRITPLFDRACVEITAKCDFSVSVSFSGRVIATANSENGVCTVDLSENMHPWSPESPCLYDLTLTAGQDKVYSYFAMRSFKADRNCFLLNNKPYFINGVLDQGYFSDGIYTPAAYECFRGDIAKMKELGFNTLRKHIKVEPMIFYEMCDRMGMLVLQDMVNVGRYSFFRHTVLPMLGKRHGKPHITGSKAQKEAFLRHADALQAHLYNCPSVVYYTIFNEGWGQFDADSAYDRLRGQDKSRVYDATSGWFHEKRSDVISEHIYFKPIHLKCGDRPIIVSEFGGYSYAPEGHRFNTAKTMGYRMYKTAQELEKDFIKLYENEVIGNIKNGLCGAIYTQLSDVEDECNGLLSYDRRVCKLNVQNIAPLMARCYEEFGKARDIDKSGT